MRSLGKAGASLVTAGAFAALAVVAAPANAAFDSNHDTACENAAGIAGVGSSLQRTAQIAWGASSLAPNAGSAINSGFGYDISGCSAFKLAADGGTKTIQYTPSGSGAGRAAFGAVDVAGGARDASVDYGGTDEPLT